MEENTRPIGIDLYSGVGGMSLGFEQAGFNIATAVDVDPIHIATHTENFPNCVGITADLAGVTGAEILTLAKLEGKEISVVFGGPPCGGFSIIGKRRYDDPRNQLLCHFARIVDELKPKYFVVENVRGLLIDPMTQLANEFIEEVDRVGYSVVSPIRILDASDFGVPQRRQRIFILGYRKNLPSPKYPLTDIENDCSQMQEISVWDAISDMPNIDDFEELERNDVFSGELPPAVSQYAKILRGEIEDPNDFSVTRKWNGDGISGCKQTQHKTETVRRFRETTPGTFESISRFYRLTKEGLSPTLRAGTGKEFGSYSAPRPIHPVYPRCISVREGARLHSFPDWFQFHKTKWHGFRQVGNSVPPLMARAVAKSVICALDKTNF